MKLLKNYLFFLIIPLFILGWGIFNLYFFDPFYAHFPDPEYPYLLNGLNVALLEFNRIGHFDHPGTTFQVYNGLIIRITHFFAGKETITQDVLNRPEFYLSAISFSLTVLQALLCFLIAWIGKKRDIKTWQLIILQSGVLFSVMMLSVFGRVIPERWLVIVSLLFIIVYLLYGYKDRYPLKFAIWSGVVMGMGMATKFNFLPIILLPFFLLINNKNRLVYAVSGIASFFIFILPIINKLDYFRDFIFGIATHDGIYGKGEKRMFDPVRVKEGFLQIFNVSPALLFLIIAMVAALILAIMYKKKQETNRQILFFAGMLFISLLQMIMVAKHFNFYYMLPLITMYSFVLFMLDDFTQKIGDFKRWTLLPGILLFIIFISFTTIQTYHRLKSAKMNMPHREIERKFVDENLAKNSLWFVGTSWTQAPFVENGLAYGLAYVRKSEKYYSQLFNINPNIITYCNSEDMVKIWRGYKIPVDSIIVTQTPIHLYHSKGRNTTVLINILEKAAQRNNVNLSKDTIFTNIKTQSHIIVMQNKDSQKDWKTEDYISLK